MSDFEKNENGNEYESNVTDDVDAVEEAVEEAQEAIGISESEAVDIESGIHDNMDVDGVESAAEPSVEWAEEQVQESEVEITDAPAKKSGVVVIAVIIALIVALLAGLGVKAYMISKNPYANLGYLSSGSTIDEISNNLGMTLDEFRQEYGLPQNMPGTISESVAYYAIPSGYVAENMYGMELDELKTLLEVPEKIENVPLRFKIVDMLSPSFNIGDTVTAETPWGVTLDQATIRGYIKANITANMKMQYSMYGMDIPQDYIDEYINSNLEEAVSSLKEEYGLGDDITADTRWVSIRNIIDKAAIDNENAAKEQQNTEVVDDTDDASEGTESETDNAENAPAEGTAETAPTAENSEAAPTAVAAAE